MLKTSCVVLGAILTIVGLVGFFNHDMLGMHLTTAHNIVHLVSGVLAIYFGTRTEFAAKRFCQVFGVVYGLLGIVGFVFGNGSDRMFALLPNVLMFGTPDHVVHVLLGIVFCALGFMPARMERNMEVRSEAARDRVMP